MIFEREIDLIDVARGDVVLHGGEGAVIVLARPGELEAGDLGAPGRAMVLEPGAGAGIVERTGRAEQPDPQKRHAAVGRKESLELRLEAITELVSEEAGGMEPTREPRRDLVEGSFNLVRRVSRNDKLRLGIEQAPAARRQTVIEKNVRGSGHLWSRSHDIRLANENSPYGRSKCQHRPLVLRFGF